MPTILPYCNLFPSVVGDIFRQSAENSCVRHSVLSVSSMIADYRLRRSLDRFEYQYITTLQLIQSSLQKGRIDEGIAIAVYLMLCIDTVRADLETARKHLSGLFLVLQELQRKPILSFCGDYGPITNVSPLMMHIWRVSIKIDWTASLYLVEPPILPPIPASEEFHRQWITKSAFGTDADWALTAFSLDNLIHKACHFAAQVRSIRLSNYSLEVEKRVTSLVAILEKGIKEWDCRPLIQKAEQEEAAAQLLGNPGDAFLDYEPLCISNPFYCNLRNAWRALSIYTSLILNPRIGPWPRQRFRHAVEICRTLTALGPGDTSYCEFGKLWVILLAGVTFGGPGLPREKEWISQRMEYITTRFPVNDRRKRNVDKFTSYAEICEVEGDFWEELYKRRNRSRSQG